MTNLIVGYGYCGKYLAEEIKQNNQEVLCWSRNTPKDSNLNHQKVDISGDDFSIPKDCETIYYLIPPPRSGKTDTLLHHFLSKLDRIPKNFVYFGSSGIYGNHDGNLVDESAELHLNYDRQYRRKDAEDQLNLFAQHSNINISCLRIAGIYGPERIPLQKIKEDKPILNQQEAPYSNCIYVKDLVKIAYLLSQQSQGFEIFNVSDNHPNKMGYIQYKLATILNTSPPTEVPLVDYYNNATKMGKEFLSSSKKLDSSKLLYLLRNDFVVTSLETGLKNSI
jgi:nucleoside-diphosphate-sugar epimerase